jgi:hypothetical protein
MVNPVASRLAATLKDLLPGYSDEHYLTVALICIVDVRIGDFEEHKATVLASACQGPIFGLIEGGKP